MHPNLALWSSKKLRFWNAIMKGRGKCKFSQLLHYLRHGPNEPNIKSSIFHFKKEHFFHKFKSVKLVSFQHISLYGLNYLIICTYPVIQSVERRKNDNTTTCQLGITMFKNTLGFWFTPENTNLMTNNWLFLTVTDSLKSNQNTLLYLLKSQIKCVITPCPCRHPIIWN